MSLSTTSPATNATTTAFLFSPWHNLKDTFAVELRSLFFAIVFIAVFLILAYLTNPNEASFRTFLTELSFRRHLSKLNDSPGDSQSSSAARRSGSGTHYTHAPPRSSSSAKGGEQLETVSFTSIISPLGPSNFHLNFTSHALVSMRTPTHVFRSFGLLTIAAITSSPDVMPPSQTPVAEPIESDKDTLPTITGSWFIGAFGKWWLAGTVQLLRRDVMLLSKSVGSAAGIMNMRSLERRKSLSGVMDDPYCVSHRRGPRPSQDTPSLVSRPPARPSTPPPLPKSASLPLHAPNRGTPAVNSRQAKVSPADVPTKQPPARPPTPEPADTPPSSISTPISIPTTKPRSRSHSTSIDISNPLITDLLHQITNSQSQVSEARTQLTSFENTSSHSHTMLLRTVEEQREKKKEEDSSRAELKTRTKALEDSRRQAESTKRESEKRLKIAQTKRDGKVGVIEKLGRDVEALREKMKEDERAVKESKIEGRKIEEEMYKEVEERKEGIRSVEEEVGRLALKTKELEKKIEEEKVKVKVARKNALEKRKEKLLSGLGAGLGVGGGFLPLPPPSSFGKTGKATTGANGTVGGHGASPPNANVMNANATARPMPNVQTQQPSPPSFLPHPSLAPPTSTPSIAATSTPTSTTSTNTATLASTSTTTTASSTVLQRRPIPPTVEPEPLSIIPPPSSVSGTVAVGPSTSPTFHRSEPHLGNHLLSTSPPTSAFDVPSPIAPPNSNANGNGITGPGTRASLLHHTRPASLSARTSKPYSFDRDIVSSLTAQSSSPPSHTTSSFSPFADVDMDPKTNDLIIPAAMDNGPLSPFATSLLPMSLYQSLDASEGTGTPKVGADLGTEKDPFFAMSSPNAPSQNRLSVGSSEFAPTAGMGMGQNGHGLHGLGHPYGHGHGRDRSSSGGTHSSYEWTGSPPLASHLSHHTHSHSHSTHSLHRHNGSAGSDILYTSPTSVSFGGATAFDDRLDNQRASLPQPPMFHSRTSLPLAPAPSEGEEDEEHAAKEDSEGKDAKDSMEKQTQTPSRKWFSSSKTKAMMAGLNPDAKAFRFTRPRGSSSESAALPIPVTTASSGPNSGLLSSSTPGNFFSSLLAFAPSPAEREALRRALGGNASHESLYSPTNSTTTSGVTSILPTSPFTSPAPSARSSAVDLNLGLNLSLNLGGVSVTGKSPWANSTASGEVGAVDGMDGPSSIIGPSNNNRRSLASLWQRSKSKVDVGAESGKE